LHHGFILYHLTHQTFINHDMVRMWSLHSRRKPQFIYIQKYGISCS